jgi:hypothetical protein
MTWRSGVDLRPWRDLGLQYGCGPVKFNFLTNWCLNYTLLYYTDTSNISTNSYGLISRACHSTCRSLVSSLHPHPHPCSQLLEFLYLYKIIELVQTRITLLIFSKPFKMKKTLISWWTTSFQKKECFSVASIVQHYFYHIYFSDF